MTATKLLMIIAILVIVDFLTGYVKAYRACQLNSSIGLDGMIRKAMILFSMTVFILLDYLLNFNLTVWLPKSVLMVVSEIGIEKIGLSELLGVGVILQEGTSILENLHELGVPIPRFMTCRIERIQVQYLNEEIKK